MVTIYDLLEVDEKASKEEIEKAYSKMVLEYKVDPSQSEEENKQNEMILNKLKIAYEILYDDEKRKRYDADLAKKKAEDLLKTVTPTETVEASKAPEARQVVSETKVNTAVKKEVDDSDLYDNTSDESDDRKFESQLKKEKPEEVVYQEEPTERLDPDKVIKEVDQKLDSLTKEEQKKIKKAAQEEFNANLKRAQQAEQEYNDAYNKAYKDYLKKNGLNKNGEYSKLNQIKNIAIVIVVLIVVCLIAWCIPPVRNMLKDLYAENFIVKALVDVVVALFKAIFSAFK